MIFEAPKALPIFPFQVHQGDISFHCFGNGRKAHYSFYQSSCCPIVAVGSLSLSLDDGLNSRSTFARQFCDLVTQLVDLFLLFGGHSGGSISRCSQLHAFLAVSQSLLLAGSASFLLLVRQNSVQAFLQLRDLCPVLSSNAIDFGSLLIGQILWNLDTTDGCP